MCLKPRLIKNKSRYRLHGMREYITVPCGHCSECIAAKKESLLQRNYMEWRYIKEHCPEGFAFWSTLTLDNEHLTDKFDYKSVSAFVKSIRNKLRYLGLDVEFKYFFVSEYGETTLRPHYHIIFYIHSGVDFDTFERLVRESWAYGYTDTSYFHRQHILSDVSGIRYLIKYVNKEFGINDKSIKTDYRSSVNLGYYPDSYDYTKDIVIPSARGLENHHIGQFFLNKKCYEYRLNPDGSKVKTAAGSYSKCISQFGIDWKLNHLDLILDKFEKSLYVKFQHLTNVEQNNFNKLLAGRSFRSFSDYVYLYSGRILGHDAFQFDLSNPKEFLNSIYQYNRDLHHIGFFNNIPLDDSFDVCFKNYDVMFSLLYDFDYKLTAESSERDSQQSINRLKKFMKNV